MTWYMIYINSRIKKKYENQRKINELKIGDRTFNGTEDVKIRYIFGNRQGTKYNEIHATILLLR